MTQLPSNPSPRRYQLVPTRTELIQTRHSRSSNKRATMSIEWLADLELSEEDSSGLFTALGLTDQSTEDVSFPLTSEFPDTPESVVTKTSKGRPKRMRRRDEILFLRQEVQVLTRGLDLLRARQKEGLTAQALDWRALVLQEQQLRESREIENARLRDLLQVHMSLSEDLRRFMEQTRARYASLPAV